MNVIRLDEVNCRDCYKCIRNCLLKAIRYSDGHAQIIREDCIDCGECVVTCPRHSQQSWPDVKEILRQIRSGRQVVASVAPSFIADFDVGSIGGPLCFDILRKFRICRPLCRRNGLHSPKNVL